MRYFNIFLLAFQDTMTSWTRSIVWLLIPLINACFFMFFWYSAYRTNANVLPGWGINDIFVYYFLIIIFAAFVHSHVEDVLEVQIRQGDIAQHLLKPLPLYTAMYLYELPYRVIQGVYGLLIYVVAVLFAPSLRLPSMAFPIVILIVVSIIFSSLMFQTYKMILGLLAFWTKDNKGIQDTSQVLILFFSGFNMPLLFLPKVIQDIAYHLPFAYAMYFPIVGVQGKLSVGQLTQVIAMQALWLFGFVICYKWLLKKGLKKFSAVGQ